MIMEEKDCQDEGIVGWYGGCAIDFSLSWCIIYFRGD